MLYKSPRATIDALVSMLQEVEEQCDRDLDEEDLLALRRIVHSRVAELQAESFAASETPQTQAPTTAALQGALGPKYTTQAFGKIAMDLVHLSMAMPSTAPAPPVGSPMGPLSVATTPLETQPPPPIATGSPDPVQLKERIDSAA